MSRNEKLPETIVLIHDAIATGLDWDLVEPFLSSCHLLIPTFFTERSLRLARQVQLSPEDSARSSKRPKWQARYVKLLAQLVRKQEHGGRAHVVGLSLDASFALGFVAAHPELALSLFVSGLPKYLRRTPPPILALATVGVLCIQNLRDVSEPKIPGLLLDSEVRIHGGGWDGKGSRTTFEQASIMLDTVAAGYPTPVISKDYLLHSKARSNREGPAQKLRLRVVAATRKRKWIPLVDSPEWPLRHLRSLLA